MHGSFISNSKMKKLGISAEKMAITGFIVLYQLHTRYIKHHKTMMILDYIIYVARYDTISDDTFYILIPIV